MKNNNMERLKIMGIVVLLAVSLTGCDTASPVSAGIHYTNPAWAPPYYTGVRYYYLPDIEVYYDLSGQEFVYLDNGQWLFSPGLPEVYGGYDLLTGFMKE
jgi:hypothetical protein